MTKKHIDYYEYINSPEWKAKADAAKERAEYRCQVCNRPGASSTLHAHHRTYENLGHEKPGDITVLCADCHALFHGKKEEQVNIETLQVKKAIDIPFYFEPPEEHEEPRPRRLVTVIMRSTGDKTRDTLRIRRVAGMASTYPGSDHFTILEFLKDHAAILDIPIKTVDASEALLSRLFFLVGKENVKVETFGMCPVDLIK